MNSLALNMLVREISEEERQQTNAQRVARRKLRDLMNPLELPQPFFLCVFNSSPALPQKLIFPAPEQRHQFAFVDTAFHTHTFPCAAFFQLRRGGSFASVDTTFQVHIVTNTLTTRSDHREIGRMFEE
ncbi:PREDICTED: uncharacterized protein LOC108359466 [Rhagoletis zephyria]|uniref:uncharacterized protein LOC108359466 n=1 Tax=Rhagoletis zephyria TaxID=28612 RepID=UPI0008113C51|nr:PREDICTED: uncharacterized protein LOC108359466 [Rhagoletis zephyria]XP_036320919.1 uncharacterized protein LOC118735333 isoform X1 [Rhagoletis pomonella]